MGDDLDDVRTSYPENQVWRRGRGGISDPRQYDLSVLLWKRWHPTGGSGSGGDPVANISVSRARFSDAEPLEAAV